MHNQEGIAGQALQLYQKCDEKQPVKDIMHISRDRSKLRIASNEMSRIMEDPIKSQINPSGTNIRQAELVWASSPRK